jgi:8-oxo-dGTP pyrophosphatase MutT (NUDIX family)
VKIIKWKIINSEVVLTASIFRYVKLKSESPTTGEVGDFDLIQCLNWVNVIAITKDQNIVLIKQYRHGTDQVTVEIPGGAVNRNEDPRLGAERELREETGYTSKNWKFLGRVDANPAFMNNQCDTYLALDAELTHPQEFDPFEEIEVYLRPKKDVMKMVASGEITHSIVIAALYFLAAIEA